ncbi:polyhomeotic-like protein 1 [Pseudoliparis swirei]|uniref:polyhomeotic-like protein 1 n=1 Tax=Pseudoliparis swirei TaxID=2059687 RepID=UPI0024BE36EF|nr:polyhomeotic-like protein 1 [Pseudoliparis swirei]
METDGEQNQQGASTNGSAASGTSSRPSQMNSMSLYERQAVQALQALQRQPNAAQYFQQLMLQQQISNAQLHNLAAVQQAPGVFAGLSPRGAAASALRNESRVKRLAKYKYSASANDDDGPSPPRLQPIRNHASLLTTNHSEAGLVAPPPVSSSSPSPMLTVSRALCQGERAPPPQAVVKPNVLTHLIEGFVIQEGAEPFPVCGSVKDATLTGNGPDASQSEAVTTATVLKCEYCKSVAPASQFRGTKRFCSMTCAKRYNVSFRQHFCMRPGQTQGRGHSQGRGQLPNSDEEGGVARRRVPRRTSSEIASAKIAGSAAPAKRRSDSSRSDEESSGEEEEEEEEEEDEDDPVSLSSASSASCRPPPPLPAPPPALQAESSALAGPTGPAHWSVEEVSQFISSLQGCEEVSSQFQSQEIDGQALLLLREEHLMSTMNVKLGPALKIVAHINALRD